MFATAKRERATSIPSPAVKPKPTSELGFFARLCTSRSGRRWLVRGAVLGAFVFAIALQLPSVADDTSMDLGGIMGYAYLTIHGYQFGVDILDVTGPYGYLHFPHTYSGWLLKRTIFFTLITTAIFAVFVILAIRYFRGRLAKRLWLGAALLTTIPASNVTGPDAMFYLMMLLAAHYLLTRERYRPSRWLDLPLYFQITLLALAKSTNLVLLGFIVVLAVAQNVGRRRFRLAAWDAGCVAAMFVLLWLCADQRITNIPAYFFGVFNITSGYNETHMLTAAGASVVIYMSMGVWLLLFAGLAAQFRNRASYWRLLPTTVASLGLLLVVWKHSYVRADMHVTMFWLLAPAASLLCLVAHRPVVMGRLVLTPSFQEHFRRFTRPVICSGTVMMIFGLTATALFSKGTPIAEFTNVPLMLGVKAERMAANFRWLVDPRGQLASLEVSMAENRRQNDLPTIRRIVGSASIDAFGSFCGTLLLNGLNYHPRPCMFSINTFNGALLEANAEFYRNEATAPRFILAQYGALDSRFPPQEDSLALIEVLRHYRPVLMENGWLLLTRRANPSIDRPKVVGPERVLLLRDERLIEVPSGDAKYLVCKVKIKYSWWGRIRAFFYRPAQVYIVCTTPREVISNYFSTYRGASGFLIKPLIVNNIDLLAAYSTGVELPQPPTAPVMQLGFSAASFSDYLPEVHVSFESF